MTSSYDVGGSNETGLMMILIFGGVIEICIVVSQVFSQFRTKLKLVICLRIAVLFGNNWNFPVKQLSLLLILSSRRLPYSVSSFFCNFESQTQYQKYQKEKMNFPYFFVMVLPLVCGVLH